MQVCPVLITDISPGVQPKGQRKEEHVHRLALSMQANGQITPIILEQRGKQLFVISGHTRLEAAKRLGWESIAARILPATTKPGESLRIAVVDNTVREGLTFADAADVIREYATLTGLPISKSGEALGFKQSQVSKCVTADERLTPENKKRLLEARIGGSLAYHISQAQGAEQDLLTDKVINEGWTRKNLEQHFRSKRSSRMKLEYSAGEARVVVELPKDANSENLLEALKGMSNEVRKHASTLTLSTLGEVLRDMGGNHVQAAT